MKHPWIAKSFAGLSRLFLGAHCEWRGSQPASTQRIYFANHSSHFDFLILWSALPPKCREQTRPVAAQDYWSKGIKKFLSENVFNALLIKRVKSEPAFEDPIEKMSQALQEESSLILFPEGTRSFTGEIGDFKSGLYRLAKLRPDVELIPVYLDNLNRILPKGEFLPVPLISRILFGAALPLIPEESKEDFLTRARGAILQLKESLHAHGS